MGGSDEALLPLPDREITVEAPWGAGTPCSALIRRTSPQVGAELLPLLGSTSEVSLFIPLPC